jgi:hypothetical protein
VDVRDFTRPEPRTCGHMADRQDHVAGSRPNNCRSDGICEPGQAVCKTVGSAYASSNLAPATTSENGPWPAVTAACGPFARCAALLHHVPSRGAVSKWLRTYSGRIRGRRSGARHRWFRAPAGQEQRSGGPADRRGPFLWFRRGRPAGPGRARLAVCACPASEAGLWVPLAPRGAVMGGQSLRCRHRNTVRAWRRVSAGHASDVPSGHQRAAARTLTSLDTDLSVTWTGSWLTSRAPGSRREGSKRPPACGSARVHQCSPCVLPAAGAGAHDLLGSAGRGPGHRG